MSACVKGSIPQIWKRLLLMAYVSYSQGQQQVLFNNYLVISFLGRKNDSNTEAPCIRLLALLTWPTFALEIYKATHTHNLFM